jgi:hypothetical protein
MLNHFAQSDPPPQPPPQPPHVDVHVDLSGLAALIWQTFIDHLGDIAGVAWAQLQQHLGEVGQAIWTPLSGWLVEGLRASAEATFEGIFGAVPELLYRLPPSLTTDLPAYRAIATDPLPVALGGATLALVLLGLRTLFGAMVGRDHLVTHITGRLIPAVFLALAYPVLIVRAIGLLNGAAGAVGHQALAGLLTFPHPPSLALVLPYMALWVLLIILAIRLLLRLASSLFRFLVALVFGPVAIVLWAIPQTEWVTALWLRELVGWGSSPLLVVVALALAVPLATGQAGFLAAAAFGIAGLQAAHDLVGLLGAGRSSGHLAGGQGAIGYARLAARAGGGGAGAAAAAIPANRLTTLADQYGYA